MLEIHADLLWLGNAMDVRKPQLLFDEGISAVVDLAIEELPAQLPRELIYCRFPVLDGSGNKPSVILHSIQTIVDFLGSDTRTLIACSAGKSRSPVIAAFAIAAFLGQTPEESVKNINKQRSFEWKDALWRDAVKVFPGVRFTPTD